MEIEYVHNRAIRYTLSNDNLQLEDKVYPIAMGRCRDDGGWVLHEFHWEDYMSGFPDNPHTIIEFKQNKGENYREIITEHGYSPEQCYFKVIKKEENIKIQPEPNGRRFSSYKWVEIK